MKNKAELKQYFISGAMPDQDQFEELIISNLNSIDDKATLQDIQNGQNDEKFTTPKKVVEAISYYVPSATTTVKGLAETATLAEVISGSDTSRYVTPEGAKKAVETFAPVRSVNGQTGDVVVPDSTYDSGWIIPLLQSPIINYQNGFVETRYRLLNGVVYIEGTIKGGVSQTNGVSYFLFQLPTGFRPTKRLAFSTFKNGGGSARIDIDSAGNVYGVVYDKVLTSLTGISFPI